MKKIISLSLIVLASTSFVFAGKQITINLSKQQLTASENGKVVLRTAISTGRYGKRTPVGSFSVLRKDRKHKSSLYPKRANGKSGGANMPYTLKVTNGGVAIHEGYTPKTKSGKTYPDSHGCIRVPRGTAKKLFEWAKIGTPITIKGKTRYVDYSNKLRRSVKKKNVSVEVIERYENEFHEWGERYYDDDFTTVVYEEGSLDYLNDL